MLPSGEVINAKNTEREFAVVVAVAAPNFNRDTYSDSSQDEEEAALPERAIETGIANRVTDTSGSDLPVAIEAQAITDTVIGTAVGSGKKKANNVADGDYTCPYCCCSN